MVQRRYTERFEVFWKNYPRRNGMVVGKKMAYDKFNELSPDDQFDACRAVCAYAQSYRRKLAPGEFRPEPRDPVRFLRNEWWRDWLIPETKPCAFRSLSEPCQQTALPGERHCQKHKDYIERMDALRAEHGIANPRRVP